jgi:GNAT superfamily N-acetyltransferase
MSGRPVTRAWYVPAMDIRPLDLADASVLADAYGVECEATRQARAGWVPLGETARILAWRADNGWLRSLVGAFERDRLIGFAASSTANDTPDTTWVGVSVLPQHQRRGVGTMLSRAAERISPDSASRFVASAYRRTAEDVENLVRGFAHPLGYACATTETVVELDLVSTDLRSVQPPDGYTVATYLNGVPDHHRAQVGVLKGMVDAEAPNGALQWEPTPLSVEEYGAEIGLWQQQGRTAVESVALDGDGVVVAWTCLVTAADPHRPAQVEGTLVLSQHRGRRLGAAVKSASLLAARAHGTARVRTSSDDQNAWMRAINEQLGFVPVESEVILHKQRRDAVT